MGCAVEKCEPGPQPARESATAKQAMQGEVYRPFPKEPRSASDYKRGVLREKIPGGEGKSKLEKDRVEGDQTF